MASGSIQVLIKYDGIWDELGTYKNYKATGMLLPCDTDYKGLCNTALTFMNLEGNNFDLKIFYKMDDDCPPIRICSDSNIAFYVNLKKSETNPAKYPLCIELEKRPHSSNPPTAIWDLVARTNTYINDGNEFDYHQNHTDIPYITSLSHLSSENAKAIINVVQEKPDDNDSEDEGLTANELQELNVGATFKTKRHAQIAVCHHALTNRFNFKIEKSCTKSYFVRCVDVQCEWKFHASTVGKTRIFKVRKFNDVHTCSIGDRFKENRHATSKFIADVVRTKYRKTSSSYRPINIQEEVKEKYGIDINYHKAWRAKEKITEQIVGKASQSYSDLPAYLHMLKQANPGTIAKIKTLDDR